MFSRPHEGSDVNWIGTVPARARARSTATFQDILESGRCNSNILYPALPMHTPHSAERFLAIPASLTRSALDALAEEQEALSDTIVSYWTQFARNGDPYSAATPFWAAEDGLTDLVQSLDTPAPGPLAGFFADHQCDFWLPLLNR